MRICFYTPFKPIDHPQPSGDLVIAKGIMAYLTQKGHQVFPVSRLRTRWIYWKPWQGPYVVQEYQRAKRLVDRMQPHLWLTYHTYYKAPDLLGPWVCDAQKLPYFIFQGIYSTKRKKKLMTLPGFYLNRYALLKARHIFTNRREDGINLKRLVAENRLTYLTPGIYPQEFTFHPESRQTLRQTWGVGATPVIITAAMFRPGVKFQGLAFVIQACRRLQQEGVDFQLVIIGDGRKRGRIAQMADQALGGRVRLVGKIPRQELYRFYSAGDLFVFPGFRESLGMVYLEAQACGLPVVALNNGGIPEVVRHGHSGCLIPPGDVDRFVSTIRQLLLDSELRCQMGDAASDYVRRFHDLGLHYGTLERILKQKTE